VNRSPVSTASVIEKSSEPTAVAAMSPQRTPQPHGATWEETSRRHPTADGISMDTEVLALTGAGSANRSGAVWVCSVPSTVSGLASGLAASD